MSRTDSGGGEGRNVQRVASTYIHCHSVASGKLLCGTGASAQCWDGPGEGMGRKAQEGGGICVHIADLHCCRQKLTQHCKAIILQLKKKKVWLEWLTGRTEFGASNLFLSCFFSFSINLSGPHTGRKQFLPRRILFFLLLPQRPFALWTFLPDPPKPDPPPCQPLVLATSHGFPLLAEVGFRT